MGEEGKKRNWRGRRGKKEDAIISLEKDDLKSKRGDRKKLVPNFCRRKKEKHDEKDDKKDVRFFHVLLFCEYDGEE